MSAPSLSYRLALLQQILAAVLMLVFSASAVFIMSRTLDRQELTFLTHAADDVALGLGREWQEEQELGQAARAVLEESAPSGVEIEIQDESGRTVASTATAARKSDHGSVRSTRVHLPRGAWIVASVPTRARHEAVSALVMALVLTGIPLFIAVAFLSRRLAARMLRPLSRMAGEAERASEVGAVTSLGEAADPAEVEVLTRSFNRLLARLDEMLQAERRFTEDAAHELRTPLTVVSGDLEHALSALSPLSPQRAGLVNASLQVRAMADLVEALLFLRHAGSTMPGAAGCFAPVNMCDVLRDARTSALTSAPERDADITMNVIDEVLVTGEPSLLASAVLNLLSNAIKFTERGQAIHLSVASSSSECVLVVEDSGRGIAPEERDRIFDPFYRDPEARATQEGSGLGLAILRRVARAHGGDVSVSRSSLGGARFEFRLPLWAPAA